MTVVRELQEELGFNSQVVDIVHSGVLVIDSSKKSVLVVTYLCALKSKSGEMEMMGEDGAAEFQSFLPSELSALAMPEIYRLAILKALNKMECQLTDLF